jgi:hypothetical protein
VENIIELQIFLIPWNNKNYPIHFVTFDPQGSSFYYTVTYDNAIPNREYLKHETLVQQLKHSSDDNAHFVLSAEILQYQKVRKATE